MDDREIFLSYIRRSFHCEAAGCDGAVKTARVKTARVKTARVRLGLGLG